MTPFSTCRIILPLLILAALADAAQTPRPRVLALVNGKAITNENVVKRLQEIDTRLQKETPPRRLAGAPEQNRENVLDLLIQDELLLAEARQLINRHEFFKNKIEEQVHDRIDRERRKAGGDGPYKDALERQGLTYDEHITATREQLQRSFMIEQFVKRGLSVTPQEVAACYQRNLSRYRIPPRTRFRQIFIPVDQDHPRQDAWREAEDVMRLLRKQHDFARLVPRYSSGPRKNQGGLRVFPDDGQPHAPVKDAVLSLPVGEFSDPIEAENGFTIIKIEHREKARVQPLEEVHEEIEKALLEEKREALYTALIKRLAEKHYVKRIP